MDSQINRGEGGSELRGSCKGGTTTMPALNWDAQLNTVCPLE